MGEIRRFPQAVAKHLGYYVYLYVSPETGEPFYVGKGRGNRALCHVAGEGDTPHDEVIRDLRKRGIEPRVEILIHGLEDESTALAVEMAAIDLLKLEKLSTCVHGHHSRRRGRMSLEQIMALYQRKQVDITEPAILIRIARKYRYGMTPVELYDATRSAWKIGKRGEKAEYALAVFDGIVREVYQIPGWFDSGSTFRNDRPHGDPRGDRREFVGVQADAKVREKYLNHSVAHYFKEHSQNPLRYVNC